MNKNQREKKGFIVIMMMGLLFFGSLYNFYQKTSMEKKIEREGICSKLIRNNINTPKAEILLYVPYYL